MKHTLVLFETIRKSRLYCHHFLMVIVFSPHQKTHNFYSYPVMHSNLQYERVLCEVPRNSSRPLHHQDWEIYSSVNDLQPTLETSWHNVNYVLRLGTPRLTSWLKKEKYVQLLHKLDILPNSRKNQQLQKIKLCFCTLCILHYRNLLLCDV